MNISLLLLLSNISIIASFTPSCSLGGRSCMSRTSKPIMNRDTTKLYAAKSAKSSKSTKSAKSKSKSKSKSSKASKAKAVEEKPVTVLKSEFISSLSAKTGLSKIDSQAALTAVLDIIQEV